MSTQFFARYVPPTAEPSTTETAERAPKRKRSGDDAEKKEKSEERKKKRKDGEKVEKKDKSAKKDKKRKHAEEEVTSAETPVEKKQADAVPSAAEPTPAPKPVAPKTSTDEPSGHSLILQKLRRTLALAKTAPAPAPASDTFTDPLEADVVEATGLIPLPQPEPTKAAKPISALSSLPPWLKTPISVLPSTRTPWFAIPGLSSKLQAHLTTLELKEAFAVQTEVLPMLLNPGGDVCISAATGSGKTLAYVLPIIQSLTPRVVTRLRAIIVVPTRELVQQVNTTAISLSSGTGLKIGTAIGSRSLLIEQALLVSNDDGAITSKVDILITTPGRLVEHVRATPGFDLRWVKWLVIDEADRLLAQSFQEWVDVVVVGLENAAGKHALSSIAGVDLGDLGLRSRRTPGTRKVVLSATMTRDVGKLAGLRLRKPSLVVVEDPPLPEDVDMGDAADADADEEMEQFSVPAGLREHAVPVEHSEYKPLYLLYLLRAQKITTGALVFVKSNEGAARLAKLVETVEEKFGAEKMVVGLVTGEMEKKRREKVLKRFAKGEVHLYVPLPSSPPLTGIANHRRTRLICSDLISRGLDLPNIRHIVNYDIPASTRAYVHRVGRTARAGNEGDAWTLLGNNEARWFWRNIGKAVRRAVSVKKIPVVVEAEGVGLRGVYEEVLYAV